MIKIKFVRQGANSVLGGFSAGDVARVSDAFAAHLVNEARVAVYAEDAPAKPVPEKRTRKLKEQHNAG